MVVEWFMGALVSVFSFILGLFPSWTAPAWLATVTGHIATFMGYGSTLGTWIPWSAMVNAATAIGVVWLVALGIRTVRIVASFLTGGGGSAA